MNRKGVSTAISEAKRFISRAEQLLAVNRTADGPHELSSYLWPREQGSCRRASMDLTRALAAMRKP